MFYTVTVAAMLLMVSWSSRTVTVLSENRPLPREHCIVIDPGHGGIDGGAVSCTGAFESGINLDIAIRLNDLFHLLGYDTRMVRSADESVYTEGDTITQKKRSDLKERVRMVKETENALLISLHQNNFPDSKYSGAQVFYAGTEGSRNLADKMQSQLVQTLNPGSNRKSKPSDGIYLMEHICCTGILIECGFLSNVREEALLRSREYQQKLCCVIASTVDRYLSNT